MRRLTPFLLTASLLLWTGCVCVDVTDPETGRTYPMCSLGAGDSGSLLSTIGLAYDPIQCRVPNRTFSCAGCAFVQENGYFSYTTPEGVPGWTVLGQADVLDVSTNPAAAPPACYGDRILRFVATTPDGAAFGPTVALRQVIDLRDVRLPDGDPAALEFRARALFNRANAADDDGAFELQLQAYDGDPAAAGSTLLDQRFSSRRTDADPATWEEIVARMPYRPEATHLRVTVKALEDSEDDAAPPEFAAHYADGVIVAIAPPAPTPSYDLRLNAFAIEPTETPADSDHRADVFKGELVEFVYEVRNVRPGYAPDTVATNVAVTDGLDALVRSDTAVVRYQSHRFEGAPAAHSYDPSTGTWTIDRIEPGRNTRLHVVAEAIESTGDERSSTAQITEGLTFDRDARNDAAALYINVYGVGGEPNLWVAGQRDFSVSQDARLFLAGDTATVTAGVASGSRQLRDDEFVHTVIQLPDGIEYLSHGAEEGVYDASTGRWDLGPGDRLDGDLTISTRVEQSATLAAFIADEFVRGANFDPTPTLERILAIPDAPPIAVDDTCYIRDEEVAGGFESQRCYVAVNDIARSNFRTDDWWAMVYDWPIQIVDPPDFGTLMTVTDFGARHLIYRQEGRDTPRSDAFTYRLVQPDGTPSNLATVSIAPVLPRPNPVAVHPMLPNQEDMMVGERRWYNPSLGWSTFNQGDVTGNAEQLFFTVASSDTSIVDVDYGEPGDNLRLAEYRGRSPGIATITITATDYDNPSWQHSEDATVVVSRAAHGPVVVGVLPDRTLSPTAPVDTTDLPAVFLHPDGAPLTYRLVTPPAGFVQAQIDGTDLLLDPQSLGGPATVTVEARDPDGRAAQQSFTVEVIANRPPVLAAPLPDQTLDVVAGPVTVDLDAYFDDPDGDALQYTWSSLTALIAFEPEIAGSELTLTPLRTGGPSTLTVAAIDGNGGRTEASLAVTVTTSNAPPVVAAPIPDWTLDAAGPPINIDLTQVFSDPEGDSVTYARTAEAGSEGVFDATLSGATLTITPQSIGGPFQVQVVAQDDRGRTATDSFLVTVVTSGNEPPVIAPIPGPIADQAIRVGTSASFELNLRFTDPDLDPLTYTVTPEASSEAVFAATLTDDLLQIDGLSAGGPFDLTVTAEDPFGATATMTFAVVVFETNTPPALVLDLPDLQLALGQPLTFDVAKHFADPDSLTGEPLTYQASTGDPSVVTAAVAGSALTLTPQDMGSGSASVSAFDVVGANTGAAFTVSVGSGDGVTPIANEDRARTIADAAVVIDILDNDTDPNGDGLDIMQIRAQPVNGTATFITQDGITQVEYQSNAGFKGTDTFTYRYRDQANNWSNDATVEVIVEPGPDT